MSFLGSLEFGFCDVALHGERRQTRSAASPVGPALLDVGLEQADVGFKVEHLEACGRLISAHRTGTGSLDRGESGLRVGAGVEECFAGGVGGGTVLTCRLADGVDGAAEQENVQATFEHVASVTACGLGREGDLKGELLGVRAPRAGVGGWHVGFPSELLSEFLVLG